MIGVFSIRSARHSYIGASTQKLLEHSCHPCFGLPGQTVTMHSIDAPHGAHEKWSDVGLGLRMVQLRLGLALLGDALAAAHVDLLECHSPTIKLAE